jgi:GT2 family glycosyltransferase
MTPLVVATIVNWNGRELTLRLLRSLSASGPSLKIIVVDNASDDGSVDAVREKFPAAEIISLSENIGYSAGINKGIERATDLGAQYHWVFNNDVEVEKDTLSRLLEVMEADRSVGIAGPLVFDYATGRLAHAGYRVNLWLGWITDLKAASGKSFYEVDSAFGCSNLIRAETARDVGPFDPSYNVYFDETDFNTRARRKGWRVVVVRGARVRHEESATMNRRLAHKAWLLLKNLLRFELKNARFYQLPVFLLYYFLVHVPYFFIRGTFEACRISMSKRA